MLLIEDEAGHISQGEKELIERAFQAVMDELGIENACAALKAVDDEEIRRLNLIMRGIDKSTDVLSFPEINYPKNVTLYDDKSLLKRSYDPSLNAYFIGDIALSFDRARQQARELGHSVDREEAYLTAHAALHLSGYDHIEESDAVKMRQMEKRAMKRLGIFKNGGRLMNNEDCIQAAIEALNLSYSPYSNFRVGACLVSEDGQTFMGANLENASLGATICAERCAVSNAIAHGVRRFTKIFISCDDGYAWPCGICRQVLNEFKAGDMEIWAGSPKSDWKMKPLSELLPDSFGPEDLNK